MAMWRRTVCAMGCALLIGAGAGAESTVSAAPAGGPSATGGVREYRLGEHVVRLTYAPGEQERRVAVLFVGEETGGALSSSITTTFDTPVTEQDAQALAARLTTPDTPSQAEIERGLAAARAAMGR